LMKCKTISHILLLEILKQHFEPLPVLTKSKEMYTMKPI
jgi:hypothetical protein